MKPFLALVFLTAFSLTTLAQTKSDIERFLSNLSGQSEDLTKDYSVIKMLDNGEKLLPALSKQFMDSTVSMVFSKCMGRYLTRGEVAMVLADRIETMPYFTLTGLQNCLMQSCENNPNFVEYYLDFIKLRGTTATVQERYNEWLNSADRKRLLETKKRE